MVRSEAKKKKANKKAGATEEDFPAVQKSEFRVDHAGKSDLKGRLRYRVPDSGTMTMTAVTCGERACDDVRMTSAYFKLNK